MDNISENSPLEKVSKWNEIGLFFKTRSKEPWQHPEFVLYFIFFVVIMGGISIWASLYIESHNKEFNHNNVLTNIFSFIVVIITTGSIEMAFAGNKYIKNLLFIISVIVTLLSIFTYLAFFKSHNPNLYFLAVPFFIFSIFIWWIANAENANLTQDFFVIQSDRSKELNNSLDDYDKK